MWRSLYIFHESSPDSESAYLSTGVGSAPTGEPEYAEDGGGTAGSGDTPGGEEEEIIIDPSFANNECLVAIYEALGEIEGFKNYLSNYESMTLANLTLSANSNFSSFPQSYHTAGAITIPPISNNTIEIVFNTDPTLNSNIENFSDVTKALAFTHELLHAEMFRMMLEAARHAGITQNNLNWTNYSPDEFENFLNNSLLNNYPGLHDYFTRYYLNIPADQQVQSWQHNLMAEHYRDTMKDVLASFNPALTNEQKEALSWLGLQNTVAWNNLSPEQQAQITNLINQINNTFPNGCN